MGRASIMLRDAGPADVPSLQGLWGEVMRRGSSAEREADLVRILARVDRSEDERLVVAEYDGQVVGAVLLKVATMTAINLDPVVQVISPHVAPAFQRRGIGVALMDAAVTFAEERGVPLLATAALSTSRDSNRFFARLSLGPQAMLRIAPAQVVRQRLTALHPASSRLAHASHRHLDKVLAARRFRRSERV